MLCSKQIGKLSQINRINPILISKYSRKLHYLRHTITKSKKLRYTLPVLIGGTVITTANAIHNAKTITNNKNEDNNENDIEEPTNAALNSRQNEAPESIDEIYERLMEHITIPQHTKLMWCWLYLKRAIFLLFNFTPLMMLLPLAYLDHNNTFGIRGYWLKILPSTFGNAGSTFIKLGKHTFH